MPADPIIIIGAGKAGLAAAAASRDRGYSGEIAIATDEPGVPYDRPPLSKAFLTEKGKPDRPLDLIFDHATLSALNIIWLPAAVSIDRNAHRLTLADGQHRTYQKLLLATGAAARKLRLPGAECVLTLRNLNDAIALRDHFGHGRKIAIIGGGFIGLELAASARTLGAEVTVIEALPRVLMRGVPASIAAAVAERHRQAGVEILTGIGIDRIEPDSVILAGGRAIKAGTVIAGIGAEPRTELAKAAGLLIDNEIVVDASGRTSNSDIFAAGDCCSFPHPVYEDRKSG